MTTGITFRPPFRPDIVGSLSKKEGSHLFHKANFIGNFVRKTFFFQQAKNYHCQKPINKTTNINNPHTSFWNAEFPDLKYPKQTAIKEHFDVFDQYVTLTVGERTMKLKCRIIESKNCPKQGAFNHFLVQGTTSTLENNIHGVYPFLESYIKAKESNNAIAPGRFIIFNHYDNKIQKNPQAQDAPYLPGDMDEWGFMFKKTLESLTNYYGKFQLASAHSLGNIPLIACLDHMKDEEFKKLFPTTLFLAHGPSSLREVSKNVPFQWGVYPKGWFYVVGLIMYFLAKWTGWTTEPDKILVQKLKHIKQLDPNNLTKTNIVISKVKHDFFFPGQVSLAESKKLDQLKGVVNLYRLSFDFHHSVLHRNAHHDCPSGSFQRLDLIKEKLLLENKEEVVNSSHPREIFQPPKNHPLMMAHGETLATTVIRSALATS